MPNQLSGPTAASGDCSLAGEQTSIILADEPTETSIAARRSGHGCFQRLNQERGITIALVTHEPDIAQYARRIIVFKDGRIKNDYMIKEPRSAREELESLPPLVDDEEDDE
jgi:putative ABC transport system ATP-binding protein